VAEMRGTFGNLGMAKVEVEKGGQGHALASPNTKNNLS